MTLSVDRPKPSGPKLARPYTLTGGRTRAPIDLPLEVAIEALVPASRTDWPASDARTDILELCQRRPSIAEISALLNLPVGVTRVLVADLVESAHLRVHNAIGDRTTSSERRKLIERTLRGLRAL